MKRILLAFLLLGLMCCAAVSAAAEFAIIDNTSSLNLRAGPGYEYQIIGKASKNDWVEIHSGFNGWDYVTLVRTGKTGYMLDSFLRRESAGGSETGIVHNPSASGFLNLREYPSYSAKVLGIYYNGSVCRILSHSTGWYMVEIEGQIGYFRQEYLIVAGVSTAYVTSGNKKPVNVRSGPSMAYSAIGSLEVGTEVSVLLRGSGFCQIGFGGTKGFMSSAYLSESGGGAPVTSGYLIVNSPNGGKVNLRAQPASTAKVLTKCQNGTRLEVIEGGLNWCKVYSKTTSITGYIMTRFTTVYGLPGTPTKTVSNGKNYVNLRRTPTSSGGNVLKRIDSGEKVVILIPGDEWTQVRYGTLEGYMMTHFLK